MIVVAGIIVKADNLAVIVDAIRVSSIERARVVDGGEVACLIKEPMRNVTAGGSICIRTDNLTDLGTPSN